MRSVIWLFIGIAIFLVVLVVAYVDLDLGFTPQPEVIFQNHTVYVYLPNGSYIDKVTTIKEPCPVPEGPSRINHIEITEQDNDTTTNWNDDDGKLRIVTLMYKSTEHIDLQWARRLVGSLHHFEKEKTWITVFGYQVPEDYYLEIRTFSFLRWVTVPEEHAGSFEDAQKYSIESSQKLYQKFIFLEFGMHVMFKAEGLAKRVNEETGKGKITLDIDGKHSDRSYGFISGDGSGIVVNFNDYLHIPDPEHVDEQYGRCVLLRNITSVFRTRHIYSYDNDRFRIKDSRRDPDDKMVCVSIATYSGSNPISVDDFSLLRFVMPSFLESTKDVDTPTSRYRFAMYLGVQRDPFYDDPAKMEDIKQKIISQTKDRSFSLRIFFSPLNAPALDITYKWNVLLDQSYRDGCDYIYQYSDDTIFTSPWVEGFVRHLEAAGNFGLVGATDKNNYGVMTLGFAHRQHIQIFGSFWPSHLKNWWSDEWAQGVYGQRYTLHSREILMENTQNQGQRYPACGAHESLWRKLMQDESRPKIVEWLHKQAQTYDIKQKLNYYEKERAEGAK